MKRVAPLVAAFLLVTPTLTSPSAGYTAGYNWLQFNFNSRHTGDDTAESAISRSTVGSLHRLFRVSLPSIADGAPAYLSGVSTASGTRDLLYLTTKDGHILALNAHTGATVWSRQYGPGTCRINNGTRPCYTTSSPAVDPALNFVYSYGLDGQVHKYKVGDGVEVTGGGWPERVTKKRFDEKGSSALSISTSHSTSYLHVTTAGYPGDRGDYQGHVTTINLATGSQTVFNALCSEQSVHFAEQPGTPDCPNVQSAVWARPGVVYDPATDRIYCATGNGAFSPVGFDWGDSVLALHPNGTGSGSRPVDSYTPVDYQSLQDNDLDLGSTAPAILPVASTSKYPHIAVQGGKDSKLRLLNLDNLNGHGAAGYTGGLIGTPVALPQGGEIFAQPATWVDPSDGSAWVFVSTFRGISAFKVVYDSSGNPSLSTRWKLSLGGSSPIIAGNVLFYATGNAIYAMNPATGSQLWHDATIGGIHWQSPIVANGVLYITDENRQLTAYGL